MPTSTGIFISHGLVQICTLNPKSVLDVGCGFGLWGYLCRLYLDVFPGRVQKDDWQVRIEGVEAYPKYIMPHQRFLYDEIHTGRIQDIFHSLPQFELYIFGDVLEHMEKSEAIEILNTAYRMPHGGVLINIPLGSGWLREGTPENKFEAHISAWELADFADYAPHVCGVTEFPEVGAYASLFFHNNPGERQRAESNWELGQFYLDRDVALARKFLERAIALQYPAPEPHFDLANLLITQHDIKAAIAILRDAVSRFPNDPKARTLLAQLVAAAGKSKLE